MNSHATSAARRFAGCLMFGLIGAVSACATPPSDPAARADFEAMNDPFEPMNREILDFDQFLDRNLLKPVAQGYRTVVPQFGRDTVRHFLNNLGEPVIFANDMMQGEFKAAHDTFARFFINSTAGVGGLFDFAGEGGIKRQSGDFGQTLYAWGVPDGPYLVLPIFGPSNPRDAIGMGVDALMEPFQYLAAAYGPGIGNRVTFGRMGVSGVDERANNIDTLDELQRNAIDFYAELRSYFRQHRTYELRHGRPAPIPNRDTLGELPQSAEALPTR